MSNIRKVILSALLLALTIVLARFLSINTAHLSIGFSFVPMILSAIWLGPKYSAIVCGLADLIGALLFPFGTYFFGFTISAILRGIIYGFILYKKDNEFSNKELIVRLTISCILVMIIIDIFMNALWLKLMYDRAFFAVLTARIVPQLIMFPIKVGTVFALVRILKPIEKKYLFEGEQV